MISDCIKSLGLEVLPSIANFILVRFANSNQAKLIIDLLITTRNLNELKNIKVLKRWINKNKT